MALTKEEIQAFISTAVAELRESPTFAVVDAVKKRRAEGKEVFAFSVGQPAEPTPEYVREGLKDLINNDAKWAEASKYSPTGGLAPLKKAIVEKFADENGLEYTPSEILVSNGGKQAIANAFAATINKGDEVLMSDPQWVSYPDIVKFHGGVPVALRTNKDFKITPEALKANIKEHPKAKWLVLNSPSNPTGAVYSKNELAALGQVVVDENEKRKSYNVTARAHGQKQKPLLMVMSDDIYEHMVYNDNLVNRPGDPSAVSYNIIMANPDMKPYTMIINGVAKAFGMTGYRVGYAAGPEMLIKKMSDYQGMETSGASAIAQMASEIALKRGNKQEREAHFASQREAYQTRRALLNKLINETHPPA